MEGIFGNADDLELPWIAPVKAWQPLGVTFPYLWIVPTKVFLQWVFIPEVVARHGFVDDAQTFLARCSSLMG